MANFRAITLLLAICVLMLVSASNSAFAQKTQHKDWVSECYSTSCSTSTTATNLRTLGINLRFPYSLEFDTKFHGNKGVIYVPRGVHFDKKVRLKITIDRDNPAYVDGRFHYTNADPQSQVAFPLDQVRYGNGDPYNLVSAFRKGRTATVKFDRGQPDKHILKFSLSGFTSAYNNANRINQIILAEEAQPEPEEQTANTFKPQFKKAPKQQNKCANLSTEVRQFVCKDAELNALEEQVVAYISKNLDTDPDYGAADIINDFYEGQGYACGSPSNPVANIPKYKGMRFRDCLLKLHRDELANYQSIVAAKRPQPEKRIFQPEERRLLTKKIDLADATKGRTEPQKPVAIKQIASNVFTQARQEDGGGNNRRKDLASRSAIKTRFVADNGQSIYVYPLMDQHAISNTFPQYDQNLILNFITKDASLKTIDSLFRKQRYNDTITIDIYVDADRPKHFYGMMNAINKNGECYTTPFWRITGANYIKFDAIYVKKNMYFPIAKINRKGRKTFDWASSNPEFGEDNISDYNLMVKSKNINYYELSFPNSNGLFRFTRNKKDSDDIVNFLVTESYILEDKYRRIISKYRYGDCGPIERGVLNRTKDQHLMEIYGTLDIPLYNFELIKIDGFDIRYQ